MTISPATIEQVLALYAQEYDARKRAEETEQEASEAIKELQKRIEAGETTGNPILDFVIIGEDPYYLEEAQAAYQKLQDGVRKHKGELILVASGRKPKPGGDSYPPEELRLGVLSDSSLLLSLELDKCQFPTATHARSPNPPKKNSIEIIEGNIVLLQKFRRTLYVRPPVDVKNQPHFLINVIMGSENVRIWFEEQQDEHYLAAFQGMKQGLGIFLP